jgi:hypothetical protein
MNNAYEEWKARLNKQLADMSEYDYDQKEVEHIHEQLAKYTEEDFED